MTWEAPEGRAGLDAEATAIALGFNAEASRWLAGDRAAQIEQIGMTTEPYRYLARVACAQAWLSMPLTGEGTGGPAWLMLTARAHGLNSRANNATELPGYDELSANLLYRGQHHALRLRRGGTYTVSTVAVRPEPDPVEDTLAYKVYDFTEVHTAPVTDPRIPAPRLRTMLEAVTTVLQTGFLDRRAMERVPGAAPADRIPPEITPQKDAYFGALIQNITAPEHLGSLLRMADPGI